MGNHEPEGGKKGEGEGKGKEGEEEGKEKEGRRGSTIFGLTWLLFY